MNSPRRLWLLACVAQALVARGATSQATGGSQPVAPRPDETAATREFRVSAFSISGKRSVTFPAAGVSSATPTLTSLELVLRGGDGGIRLRYETAVRSGGVPAGDPITYLDGRFNLGATAFNFEVGYLLRRETFAGADTSVGFVRGGFRGDYHVGAASGIVVGWAASYLRQPNPASGKTQAEGIEGETSVLYTPPGLPLYVQLGFRREIMRFTPSDTPATGTAPTRRLEEMSLLFIGIGFQRGLR